MENPRPPLPGSYFFTITLKPKLYKYSSVTQYELTYGTIQHHLMTTVQDFEFVPEHTQQGNIHYHGWIYDNNPLQRINLLNKLKRDRTLGFIKMTPEVIITNEQIKRSHDYLCKDYVNTRKLLKGVPRAMLIISPEH